ncbi:hypothetical protein SAMN02745216_00932 [Desulfatibacillum alkenivorans DSM 16219]|uniref:LPP20 lipoprotein n=1 Tax=Desulfatibacillum alkenivorans DSM 16219 TaxID=1121393 RepID=A0A1M6FWQ3_9BACT|nr:hypothetical protein [Desulfatibacillum alkenivorans]SHJ02102.1 hypothetical protein SAMN02745216_00932 [Desulfatibacillum alkenivorans DSM 16219]
MRFQCTAVRVVVLALLVLAGVLTGSAIAKPFEDVIEHVGLEGVINWSQGYIEAKGTGVPPEEYEKFYGKPQARSMAIRGAQIAAYDNLLKTARSVRIQSTNIVDDSIGSNEEILDQVVSMVRGAKMVHREYLSDGTVEVSLRMPLLGGFTQLFLPSEYRTVPDVKAVSSSSNPQGAAAPPGAAEGAETPAKVDPDSRIYTGMVVDARGLGLNPSMAPVILDEDGKEVFGSNYVSREFAVHQGMAGFTKEMTVAEKDRRVEGRPLIVKGVKIANPGKSDIIISKADADLIRGTSENLSFLKQCRVVIVLD